MPETPDWGWATTMIRSSVMSQIDQRRPSDPRVTIRTGALDRCKQETPVYDGPHHLWVTRLPECHAAFLAALVTR